MVCKNLSDLFFALSSAFVHRIFNIFVPALIACFENFQKIPKMYQAKLTPWNGFPTFIQFLSRNIFRWNHHGTLRFFFRCHFLGVICETLLSFFRIFAENLPSPKKCLQTILGKISENKHFSWRESRTTPPTPIGPLTLLKSICLTLPNLATRLSSFY